MPDRLKSRKSLTYEQIIEEKQASDARRLITYPCPSIDFKDWLEQNKPSTISVEDGVGWITVESCIFENVSPNILEAQKAWEDIINLNTAQITFNSIQDIAQSFCDTRGKWLFHVWSGDEVDQTWNTIATNMWNGELGNLCCQAKVSSFDRRYVHPRHIIAVYNSDFTNREAVEAVDKELRSIGVEKKMRYKPEIYSHFRIYSRNPWNIYPTIFQSKYDAEKKESKIFDKPFSCIFPPKSDETIENNHENENQEK